MDPNRAAAVRHPPGQQSLLVTGCLPGPSTMVLAFQASKVIEHARRHELEQVLVREVPALAGEPIHGPQCGPSDRRGVHALLPEVGMYGRRGSIGPAAVEADVDSSRIIDVEISVEAANQSGLLSRKDGVRST